jgi:hypothetical protein
MWAASSPLLSLVAVAACSSHRLGSADAGGLGDGAAGEVPAIDGPGGASYSACQFGSGVGRTLIAKHDPVLDLCLVLILDRPGTKAFSLVTPAGWGVEAAFAAAPAGSNCQWFGPPAGAVAATAVTGNVTITNFSVDVDATLTFPAGTMGIGSERLVDAALDSTPACSGGASTSTHAVTFTGSGVHVFAAEWLVFQPDLSGSVNSDTEVATSPATWATHPRALEAQSLSLCGSSLNEGESIRNLEAAGFPQPQALANVRLVAVGEAVPDQMPVTFCTGVRHADGTWSFQHAPVQLTLDAAAGHATGGVALSEDQVDLIAVLFERDVFVSDIQYQTSP